MSYCILHDAGDKHLWGVICGKHLKGLEYVSGPAMKKFLKDGVAGSELIGQMKTELSAKVESGTAGKDERQILRKLKKCISPIVLAEA